MAIVSGASRYRLLRSKLGDPAGASPGLPIGMSQWAPATVYPAGAVVVNGGFVFSTVAGGTSAAAVALGPTPTSLTDNTVTWVLKQGLGLCEVTTTQKAEVGLIEDGIDDGPNSFGMAKFIYVKFNGATAPGDFVVVNKYTPECIATAAAKRGFVGISMGTGADGSYGWVMLMGVHDAANLGNGASVVGQIAYLSATAGRVLTTVAAGDAILGLVIRVTGTAAHVGTAELCWPVATGTP